MIEVAIIIITSMPDKYVLVVCWLVVGVEVKATDLSYYSADVAINTFTFMPLVSLEVLVKVTRWLRRVSMCRQTPI